MLIPPIEAAESTYHQLNWWKVLTTNFETKNEKWLYSATLFWSKVTDCTVACEAWLQQP